MLVTDFDFALPEDLIAQTAAPRGQSRLLALDRGTGSFEHRSIADLPAFLRPGDVLVVNDTRVLPRGCWVIRVLAVGQSSAYC